MKPDWAGWIEGAVVKVNGIATIAPELRASNGIIIPIDGVLVPTEQPAG